MMFSEISIRIPLFRKIEIVYNLFLLIYLWTALEIENYFRISNIC